jgi:hypothetical protein
MHFENSWIGRGVRMSTVNIPFFILERLHEGFDVSSETSERTWNLTTLYERLRKHVKCHKVFACQQTTGDRFE